MNCIRRREYKSERKEYDRHMRADEKVCQMILILHEHDETGEAIPTEQICKRNVCCVPRYRRLSEAVGEKQVKGFTLHTKRRQRLSRTL